MTTPHPPATRTRSGSSRRLLPLALFVLVGLAALLPRVLDLGGFVTHDEVEFWIDRADTFRRAIESGDVAATAITTHPGVTTMWLGATGFVLLETLLNLELLRADPFPVFLAVLRLPVALVHMAGVLLGYALLRRMLPPAMALLAALLWALDPFVIGYSRLLHVDALLATFATLALLAACLAWYHTRHPALLLLSAVCGALAVLSKSPGLALLPLIAGGALLAFVWPPPPLQRRSLWAAGGWLALWGGVCALTILLVWPAVWADPQRVYELLRIGVEVEGAQPHMTGNFFLGQRQEAPGWPFYPVTVALRLTPWTLAGLLLLPLAWSRLSPATRRSLLVLVVWVLLLTAALSLFPKKFNRYLVPVFPALDILAAVGLLGTLDLLLAWVGRQQWQAAGRWLLASGVGLVALLNAAHWHPYSIAAFNQALGGAQAGARTFAVGWGEGFGQVAHWLNRQPDITGELTISRMITSLNPYLKSGAQAYFPDEGRLRDNAGYLVVYISEVQGGPPMPPSDRFYGQAVPLHVVRIHGVDYAWIYQVPPHVEQPRPADFGEHIHLHGFDGPETLQHGTTLDLTLWWQTQATLTDDYWLFAHLVGPDGQRYAQVDMPLQTGSWQPGRAASTHVPLALPEQMPAGTYRLLIGLYRPADGLRLPLRAETAADPAISGADALLLGRWHLQP